MKNAPIDPNTTPGDLISDPYRIYKEYRATTPVVHVEALSRTLVTRFDHCKYVKQNPGLFSSDDIAYSDVPAPVHRAIGTQTLVRLDGGAHQVLRDAMAPSFSAHAIRDAWTEIFEQTAKHYVERLPRGEVVDLFSELAAPFASRSLCRLLGMPDVSDEDMCRWSQAIIDASGNYHGDQSLFRFSEQANGEIDAEVERMIPHLKREPDFSALSVMVNAEDSLALEQILGNLKIAIGGGLNEPRDSILTLLHGLLANPEHFEAVKNDPALLTPAFEEALRWVAPIQIQVRNATQDTEIDGVHIPARTTLLVVAASANHDEKYWDTPEVYDPFRERKPHHGFGGGPHFCQGAHVARTMIVKALVPVLMDRFPDMELAEPDVPYQGFAFRGPTSLQVRLN